MASQTLPIKIVYKLNQHNVDVTPETSFGQLKEIAADITKIPTQYFKLLFRGRQHDDFEWLSSAGVKPGAKIMVAETLGWRAERAAAMEAAARQQPDPAPLAHPPTISPADVHGAQPARYPEPLYHGQQAPPPWQQPPAAPQQQAPLGPFPSVSPQQQQAYPPGPQQAYPQQPQQYPPQAYYQYQQAPPPQQRSPPVPQQQHQYQQQQGAGQQPIGPQLPPDLQQQQQNGQQMSAEEAEQAFMRSRLAAVRVKIDALHAQVDAVQSGDAAGYVQRINRLIEFLTQQLLALDNIEVAGEVRLERKAEINRVNTMCEHLERLKAAHKR